MVKISQRYFGDYTSEETGTTEPVPVYTLENDNKMEVDVITFGATITSIKMPDKNGAIHDIVLGFRTFDEYQSNNNPYFGCTIGRTTNRIGQAKFKCHGNIIKVSKNVGAHHECGGIIGFSKVLWKACVRGKTLTLSYRSPDNEEGYPGDCLVHAIFELTDSNKLLIEYKATSAKPTYIDLTNHTLFNLGGHGGGAFELYKHVVCINANQITKTDNEGVPTGELTPVQNTIFDLQKPKILESLLTEEGFDGFNHNFCINKAQNQETCLVARVYHPENGRSLEIYSNQPGVQFYTGNLLPEHPDLFSGEKENLKVLRGKFTKYCKHGAFCLTTQNWPDAPNHENFPSGILLPGQVYHHSVSYEFGVKK